MYSAIVNPGFYRATRNSGPNSSQLDFAFFMAKVFSSHFTKFDVSDLSLRELAEI